MTERNNSENDSAGIKSKRRIWPRRGIYLLPHLFTTAALFSGFYAVIQTVNGDYPRAAAAIYFAMLFDACDGRVARYTNTQSVFGAEYDSLSDVIAFGVAPALLIYQWSLVGLGKLGWAAAFVYCAAVAVRLARFNVELAGATSGFFPVCRVRAERRSSPLSSGRRRNRTLTPFPAAGRRRHGC